MWSLTFWILQPATCWHCSKKRRGGGLCYLYVRKEALLVDTHILCHSLWTLPPVLQTEVSSRMTCLLLPMILLVTVPNPETPSANITNQVSEQFALKWDQGLEISSLLFIFQLSHMKFCLILKLLFEWKDPNGDCSGAAGLPQLTDWLALHFQEDLGSLFCLRNKNANSDANWTLVLENLREQSKGQ